MIWATLQKRANVLDRIAALSISIKGPIDLIGALEQTNIIELHIFPAGSDHDETILFTRIMRFGISHCS